MTSTLMLVLWLARSCVGEAGFDSGYTGECAAIAHVYKKRAELNGMSYASVMHRYSAAIKPRHGKVWVLNLRADARKPNCWSKKVDWAKYRPKWMAVMDVARRFFDGQVPDPLPDALHYGGWVDRSRLSPRKWAKIDSNFRNIFYKRRKK